jgi:hypothetical protein
MIVRKGIIRNGQVTIEQPINLPDGSEVTIVGLANGRFLGEEDTDRPPTPEELTAALAAMDKVEPFDMTDQARAEADAWDHKVNDYTIANMDRAIEDLFR